MSNPNIYDRTDPTKNYEAHNFLAGNVVQSAELNEIQTQTRNRIRSIADALFKDGDLIADGRLIVNADTGAVTVEAAKVYVAGAVRGVVPASFTVATVGIVNVGLYLKTSIVTWLEDPSLRDPATGVRNYNLPGASRTKVEAVWGFAGDGQTGEFYPVYVIENGVLRAKEPPPNLDAFTQALAGYDRDSTGGGTYVVSGLDGRLLSLQALDVQVYSIADGRAHINGYTIEQQASRRIVYDAHPDLQLIDSEPRLAVGGVPQRIDVDRAPIANIVSVKITAEKTVTITRGTFTNGSDALPDTAVLQIIEVKQGGTTYVQGSDYRLLSGGCDWSLSGAEPATGSTYSVKYRYITNGTITAQDQKGFTVAGAVDGTQILTTYNTKLPRIDRLCMARDGTFQWVKGVASFYTPIPPVVSNDLLPLIYVYQTWMADTMVVNSDGSRVVSMSDLGMINTRIDTVVKGLAEQKLFTNISARDSSIKKGIFADPFLDDSMRDAGVTQTAAVVQGALVLPITGSPIRVSNDVSSAQAVTFTQGNYIQQTLETGSMKINPYQAFPVVPLAISLNPAVDTWQVTTSTSLSPITNWFTGQLPQGFTAVLSTTTQLVSSRTSEVTYLRPTQVNFTARGFAAGETIQSITFDGVPVTPTNVTANVAGTISGRFTIPDNILTGFKQVRIIGAGPNSGSDGTAVFYGAGTLTENVWQTVSSEFLVRNNVDTFPIDPLAQTFTPPSTRQLVGVDLRFKVRGSHPVFVQLRTTEVGLPTKTVLASGSIDASAINLVGSTRILFGKPITVQAGTEYALVVLTDDADAAVATAELSKYDSTAGVWVTQQPYSVGVLLSSSNASTWTAHNDKDMWFNLVVAEYAEGATRLIDLGNVAVVDATDLVVLGASETQATGATVDYLLTLPDGSVITTAASQTVQLSAKVTGNIGVKALLRTRNGISGILHPGTSIAVGTIGTTGTYVSRAVPGNGATKATVIYEATLPSGSSVLVEAAEVGTNTWVTIPPASNTPTDNGGREYTHYVAAGVNANSIRVRLTLTGTAAARPKVRNLQVLRT